MTILAQQQLLAVGGMGSSRGSWNGSAEGEDEYYCLVLNVKEAALGGKGDRDSVIREPWSSGAKPGPNHPETGPMFKDTYSTAKLLAERFSTIV
ncbi:unnamed protein product [Sphenostylis stenocarpa]|uniref:Uncharacterized protein n=1 Tax=Sphenostylis stenocarpa TaxID=92480 RepID=A0AA86W0E0_9FABA|nr:unnamed protein product [Sphenostylis stenocarpa]